MLAKSLQPPGLGLAFVLGVFIAPIFWALAAGALDLHPDAPVVAFFGSAALALVGYFLVTPRLDREVKRLGALPFALEDYPACLGYEVLFGARLVLRIEWPRPVPADEREALADVVRGALRKTTPRWDGDALELESPTFATAFSSRGGRVFNNNKLHLHFRKACKRVLLPLHRHAPFARVRALEEVRGPWSVRLGVLRHVDECRLARADRAQLAGDGKQRVGLLRAVVLAVDDALGVLGAAIRVAVRAFESIELGRVVLELLLGSRIAGVRARPAASSFARGRARRQVGRIARGVAGAGLDEAARLRVRDQTLDRLVVRDALGADGSPPVCDHS